MTQLNMTPSMAAMPVLPPLLWCSKSKAGALSATPVTSCHALPPTWAMALHTTRPLASTRRSELPGLLRRY